MSSIQRSRNNRKRERPQWLTQQTGPLHAGQSHNHSQPTGLLWEAVNQRVGDPNTIKINAEGPSQAVGLIPGVVPTASKTHQSPQGVRGTGSRYGQPTPSQSSQGSNVMACGPQPQAMNPLLPRHLAGPQQVMPASRPQGQGGNTCCIRDRCNGPLSSYGSGAGTETSTMFHTNPFRNRNQLMRCGQPNSDPHWSYRHRR
ncbi:hypothetical protein F5148DRAFT_142639 [Russula earlei]|uniref:Uncharacterized protein n=1 Tax=Russula earlei TaxID=71964 RepID=A0ACC0U813_9AGAM|nr:hypothetical protein F5148DRAFT_142639 [Russula earlei]